MRRITPAALVLFASRPATGLGAPRPVAAPYLLDVFRTELGLKLVRTGRQSTTSSSSGSSRSSKTDRWHAPQRRVRRIGNCLRVLQCIVDTERAHRDAVIECLALDVLHQQKYVACSSPT